MKRAWEIFNLGRDIGLTVGGLGLLYMAAFGVVPSAVAPLLIPGAFGLIAAPYKLRQDERERKRP